jgi:hypothetical protein
MPGEEGVQDADLELLVLLLAKLAYADDQRLALMPPQRNLPQVLRLTRVTRISRIRAAAVSVAVDVDTSHGG